MKKTIFALILAALMLTGCVKEIDESRMPEQTAPEIESETDAPESSSESEQYPEITLPKIIYSIREADLSMIPDGLAVDDRFTADLANAIYEQTGGLEITARITMIQNSEADGLKYIYADYEAYPNDAEICESNLLYGPIYVGLELDEGGFYAPGTPMIIDEEGPGIMRENYENFAENAENRIFRTLIYLDEESHICFRTDDKTVVTELEYRGNIYDLSECCMIKSDGDNIVILSCEDRFYSSPFRITVSRDGGETWTTTYPDLVPLGQNGQHAEVGFSACEIQFMPDGQIYIFIGTNLASMTVLTVEADSDEASVLFREQIGGYETTALVNAAMVNEDRGFYTLAHPKYAASNAIYRTTDGGNTWVRCSVPMPEECTNPWTMTLYLPYQPKGCGEHEWHMAGGWEGGECSFVSYDGGWTWSIE